MGVYLRGVSLPKNREKFIKVYPDGTVVEKTSSYGETVYRHPAVEIPEPHGRLIDADELLKHGRLEDEMYGGWVVDVGFISDAPTIIEGNE